MKARSRPYNSPIRARHAEETKRSILEAARRLFAADGYTSATMDAIAAAAEVSTPTVYASFKTKQRILAALVTGAVGQPEIRKLAAAAEGEMDPERRIRKAAHVMRLAIEAEAPMLRVLWQAGESDPDLVDAWRQMHANRQRRLTEVLAPITSGTARGRLVDIAWACGSPEIFRLLVLERGWTPKQYEDWLAVSMLNAHRAGSNAG